MTLVSTRSATITIPTPPTRDPSRSQRRERVRLDHSPARQHPPRRETYPDPVRDAHHRHVRPRRLCVIPVQKVITKVEQGAVQHLPVEHHPDGADELGRQWPEPAREFIVGGEPRERQRGEHGDHAVAAVDPKPKRFLIAVARVQQRVRAPYDAPVLVRQRLRYGDVFE